MLATFLAIFRPRQLGTTMESSMTNVRNRVDARLSAEGGDE